MKKLLILIIFLGSLSINAQNYRAIHLGGNWGYNYNNITEPDTAYFPEDFIEWLHSINVEWVGLSVSLHVENSLDSTVELSYEAAIPTFTDERLLATIQWLEDNGFKTYVTLAFESLEAADSEFPVQRWQLGDPKMPNEDSNIQLENWPWAINHPDHDQFVQSFFRSYAICAKHIASICEIGNVEIFSLGTETERLFRTRSGGYWDNHYLSGLLEITDSVRSVFSGLLTYDMTFDAVSDAIDFYGPGSNHLWEDLNLDIVGLSAYFSLIDELPDSVLQVDFLIEQWQNIFNEYLIPLKNNNINLPILFLEYGYTNSIASPYWAASDEFTIHEFTDINNNTKDDGEEVQANIYNAFFSTLNDNPCIVEGAFLWGNEVMDSNQYNNDWNTMVHFGIRNKLVEEEVNYLYHLNINNPLPLKPSFILGDTLVNQNTSTQYMINSMENTLLYKWDLLPQDAGNIIEDDTTVIIEWSETYTGMAKVFVFGQNYCGQGESSDTLQIRVDDNSQIDNISQTCSVNIFPNPCDEIINIEFDNILIENIKLEIISIDGQIIYNTNLINSISKINIGNIKGIYFIRLSSSKGLIHIEKLVKY